MFDIDDVVRYIAGYSKTPGKYGNFYLEVEYEFARPVSLIFLQKLFDIPPDYPDEGVRYLIDSYKIDEKKAEALQPFVKEKLDLNKYNFQLECSDKDSYLRCKEQEKLGLKEEKKLGHNDLIRFIEAHPLEPDENGEMWALRFELQKPLSLEVINKIFNIDPNEEELFWGDEIDAEQAKALQPYFKEKLDVDRYLMYFTSKLKPEENHEK